MRAKRKLTYALVAGALALPGSAYALGLGKLTVTSALGEPLSAQIELTSASRDELDSISAKVADPSLYRQNNLTYQGVLARARVTVERLPNGNALLKVTSPLTVSEPYLDLLIDVSWASGRVVREYTFLLDPPGVGTTQYAEPVAPARGVQTAAAPRAAAPEARPAPQEAAPRAAERAPAAATPPADGYVVKRGDTLSKIAQQYKPAEVSLDQMLIALFNSNNGAFEGNNMNRLRTGAIVTVPSSEQIAATPAAEATRLVRVQASDWRAYRDRVAAGAPTVEGGAARQETSGRISTAVEDKAGAVPAGRDQVRVSREAATGSGAAAAENAVARDKALREANERIKQLEDAVRKMQEAAALRGPQVAQAPAAAPKGAAPIVPAPIATPTAPAAKEAPKPAETPKPVVEPPKAAEPAKPIEPPKLAAAPEAAKPVEATKAPEPAVVAEPAPSEAKSEAPKAPDTPKPAAKAPAKAAPKAPVSEPSFFEDLYANTPTWAIGVGALAVLGGIVALVAARRRKTTKFEDSIISGTDIKTNTVFGSTGGGVVNTGENSLASDFSREGLGNIDTDEVDPIAEAEVYLAYGRDAQAEEILKDALKKDPQRQEIYLKLLEIHAQHNKPSAFETVASELYAVSGGQGEVWQKAVALGRQLDPNNPMFAEGGGGMPAPKPVVAELDDEPAFDLGSELRSEPPRKPPVSDKALDFQLDDDISISPTSGSGSKSAADILTGADEALEKSGATAMGVVESAAEKSRVAAAAAAATAAGTIAAAKAHAEPSLASVADKVEAARAEVAEKFDLDFHLDDDERPAPMAKMRVGAGVAESDPLGSTSLTRPAAALELDKLDLQFDPERSTFEDPTPSVLDGQWHDAATKLDLAKAYQEMGDVEGAREILQEVMHEGDDQQKAEAQGLLAKLG